MAHLYIYFNFFIALCCSLVCAADIVEGSFIRVGDYACGAVVPIPVTIPQDSNNKTSVINFPYNPSLDLSNVHIIWLPESTSTCIDQKMDGVLIPNAMPCIALIATYKLKSWVAHLHWQNPRNVSTYIKNIFGDNSSDVAVTLFSAYMTPSQYEEKKIDIGGGQKVSWKDVHQGHSQHDEVKNIADLIAAGLKIPKKNIKIDLFMPSLSLLTSTYNEGVNCIVISRDGKIWSVFPKLTGIATKKSIMNIKNNNKIITDQNYKLNQYAWSTQSPIFPTSQYNQLLLQEIECLNCGNCNECLQKQP